MAAALTSKYCRTQASHCSSTESADFGDSEVCAFLLQVALTKEHQQCQLATVTAHQVEQSPVG